MGIMKYTILSYAEVEASLRSWLLFKREGQDYPGLFAGESEEAIEQKAKSFLSLYLSCREIIPERLFEITNYCFDHLEEWAKYARHYKGGGTPLVYFDELVTTYLKKHPVGYRNLDEDWC
jgi:hypothetical protein